MSIEIPTRILTVPRNLINMKEYEELVICFKMETKLSFSFFGQIENIEEELKSQVKILNEENKNIVKFRYLYDKTKIQYRSMLENINLQNLII